MGARGASRWDRHDARGLIELVAQAVDGPSERRGVAGLLTTRERLIACAGPGRAIRRLLRVVLRGRFGGRELRRATRSSADHGCQIPRGNIRERFGQLEADRGAPVLGGDRERTPGAAERIKDHATDRR